MQNDTMDNSPEVSQLFSLLEKIVAALLTVGVILFLVDAMQLHMALPDPMNDEVFVDISQSHFGIASRHLAMSILLPFAVGLFGFIAASKHGLAIWVLAGLGLLIAAGLYLPNAMGPVFNPEFYNIPVPSPEYGSNPSTAQFLCMGSLIYMFIGLFTLVGSRASSRILFGINTAIVALTVAATVALLDNTFQGFEERLLPVAIFTAGAFVVTGIISLFDRGMRMYYFPLMLIGLTILPTLFLLVYAVPAWTAATMMNADAFNAFQNAEQLSVESIESMFDPTLEYSTSSPVSWAFSYQIPGLIAAIGFAFAALATRRIGNWGLVNLPLVLFGLPTLFSIAFMNLMRLVLLNFQEEILSDPEMASFDFSDIQAMPGPTSSLVVVIVLIIACIVIYFIPRKVFV